MGAGNPGCRPNLGALRAVVLAVAIPALLAACTGGGNTPSGTTVGTPPPPAASPPPPDATAPIVTITAPTSGSTYTASSATMTLSVTATDNVGLAQIAWANSLGGSGSAAVSGTSASRSFNITLASGSNALTVTARDAAGNTAQKLLTVSYAPAPSNSVSLAWDLPLSTTNLAGYRLYYGTASGSYQQPNGQGIDVGNVRTYTLQGLSHGTRYYFAVTAVDFSGNETGYSNEAFQDVP
jgi:hypothetical protein